MVATLQKRYAAFALAFVLLAGTFGWTNMVSAAPQPHSGAIHTTQQLTSIHPHLECPPPPYNCQGG